MKFALFVLMMVSSNAFAEQYLDCKLTGQSDSAVYRAPKEVSYMEAATATLTEDGKAVRDVEFKYTRGKITAEYTRKVNYDIITSTYTFDNSRCDGEGEGSAVLQKVRIGVEGFAANQESTAVYTCTCGVD